MNEEVVKGYAAYLAARNEDTKDGALPQTHHRYNTRPAAMISQDRQVSSETDGYDWQAVPRPFLVSLVDADCRLTAWHERCKVSMVLLYCTAL